MNSNNNNKYKLDKMEEKEEWEIEELKVKL